jgi:hypothetical protein
VKETPACSSCDHAGGCPRPDDPVRSFDRVAGQHDPASASWPGGSQRGRDRAVRLWSCAFSQQAHTHVLTISVVRTIEKIDVVLRSIRIRAPGRILPRRVVHAPARIPVRCTPTLLDIAGYRPRRLAAARTLRTGYGGSTAHDGRSTPGPTCPDRPQQHRGWCGRSSRWSR